ncbi:MAG: NAD(P)/FAD-dependent oxidoreductase [Candidatus Margulisbacteria bacterium]|nr:NAD(P)/FAD-dependent oxidoreductase [Candidatus Margulisiibacteriota bacterium]
MGYQQISFNLPTDYTKEDLRQKIAKKLRLTEFTYHIENKSLDARNKKDIHWQIKVEVFAKSIKGFLPKPPKLKITFKNRKQKVLVVGSGPAGFFSAYVLQKAGFQTTIIEQGKEVIGRAKGIKKFEATGIFDVTANYAFGEGGAGTFSDGKLTARSKHASLEKQFVLDSYIEAGAPEEITYLAHPHLGSDNLISLVKKLREMFQEIGGKIEFETSLVDIVVKKGKVVEAKTSIGILEADYFIVAPGHSSYSTYRMLLKRGVKFSSKNFAIGARVEHPQTLINKAQWGKENLPGLTSAEYRLTYNSPNSSSVYSFCMCPGGVIVPSTSIAGSSTVNGMSFYKRNGQFANAACVVALNLNNLLQKEVSAIESLDWVEQLEQSFYQATNSYKIPTCSISDFITGKDVRPLTVTSYPLGVVASPLWEMLPATISSSLKEGLIDFSKKLKGFEEGQIMGLESKTSAPIQALRDEQMSCVGFDNLYVVGEGSGYSGGIISSAVDGIKIAMNLIK